MENKVKEFNELSTEEKKNICVQIATEFLNSDEYDMVYFINHNYAGLKLTPGKVLDYLGYQAKGDEEFLNAYYLPLLNKVHPFRTDNPELKKTVKEMVVNVSIRIARGSKRNLCEGCTLIDIEKQFGSIKRYAHLVKELREADMVSHREWQNNLEFIKRMSNKEHFEEIHAQELEYYNANKNNKKR